MKKLPAVINNRASVLSLRWTGVAIAAMQLVYVTATLISDYTTGISTPYSLTAVFVMLGTMAVLAIVNIAKVIFVPKNNVAYHCVMVAYYVSLILFSVCVYNQYRDAVLAILWIIVLSTTGILFGRASYCVGVVVMVITTILSPIPTYYSPDHVVALAITVVLTIFASFLFYRYREWGLIEMRDYNRLKRRERLQTRRLRAVVNNLKDALISISPDGIIQLYNSAALNLLDTNTDILGQAADQVVKLVDENNNPIKMIETGTAGLGDLTCTIFTDERYDTVRDVSTVEVGNIIFWTTTASDGRTWNHKGTVFATAEGHPNRS